MDMSRLEDALMQAHAAGDTESATVLANEIRNRRNTAGTITDPAEAKRIASEKYANGVKAEDWTWWDKINGGLKHGNHVVGSAVQDLLPKGASDWLDEKVWDGKRKETLNNGAAFVDRAGLLAKGGAFVNESIPTLTAALATSGAGLLPSLVTQATTAFATTPGDVGDRALGATAAMGGEALGRAIPLAVSRLANPAGKLSADTKLLVDNGIYPTLGGAIGPVAKTTEDKLMSIPLVGDLIAYGRRGAIHEENAWLANRSGIEKKLTAQDFLRDPRGAQARVGEHLDGAFAKGTDGLLFDPNTYQFQDALNGIVRKNRLTTSGMGDFNSHYGHMRNDYRLQPSVIDGSPLPPATNAPQLTNMHPRPPQLMDGEGIQHWGTDWRVRGNEYTSSMNPGDKSTGRAMNASRFALLDEVDRQGLGASTDALRLANRQWADSQVLRDAADATGSVKNSGVASPNMILNKFKSHAEDGGYGRAFREGRVPGQDVAEASNRALGNNYPESGTTGRFSVASLLSGADSVINPRSIGLGLASSVLSGPAGRRYGVGARWDWQNPVAEALRRAAPLSGDLGSGLATGLHTDFASRYRQEQ